MTCDRLDADRWQMNFSEPEAYFFMTVLVRLVGHYGQEMMDLPPALRLYWEKDNSLGKTGDATEADDMLAEARAELRSDRLALAGSWIREFEIAESRNPWTVELTTAERDEFVAMLNDRRLLLALEMGIDAAEMEIDPDEIPDEARRAAVYEIDVLGHFIVVTLGPQIYRP